MKKLLFMVVLINISLSLTAQNFSGFEHILNLPPDSLISTMSFYTNPKASPYKKLYSVSALPYSGLTVIYQTFYGESSLIVSSYDTYYYTKNNLCFAIKIKYSLDDGEKQMKMMMPDFNVVNDSTFYAKNEDLKMVRHKDFKN